MMVCFTVSISKLLAKVDWNDVKPQLNETGITPMLSSR